MSLEESAADTRDPADSLNDQLRQLEAFVSKAEAEGESLPPEALEMAEKLREIIQALDGLTSSLEVRSDANPPDEGTAPTPKDT